MLLSWLKEAQRSGARLSQACKELGLDPRTIQRWQKAEGGEDGRRGPKSTPANKLSEQERAEVLAVVNSPEFRDKTPKQIVPLLADQGRYVASESTMYRILREEKMLVHRGRAKPPETRAPRELRASSPNQIWCWDITYLRSQVAGQFYYLYLFVDVWSRKIVGYEVHDRECSYLASELLEEALRKEKSTSVDLVLHSDNGSPMKGAILRATMDRLGITPSFSRPRVSDDNPFAEALFRTLKYRPEYPHRPFQSLEEAREWVRHFVQWYNDEHLHSAIAYLTPAARHRGEDREILEARTKVYEQAKQANPARWNGRSTRSWKAVQEVWLNPSKLTRSSLEAAAP